MLLEQKNTVILGTGGAFGSALARAPHGMDSGASSPGVVPYIAFDRTSGVPLYQQIYEGLRQAIISGRLPRGQRLPSTSRTGGRVGRLAIPRDHRLRVVARGGLRGRKSGVRHLRPATHRQPINDARGPPAVVAHSTGQHDARARCSGRHLAGGSAGTVCRRNPSA